MRKIFSLLMIFGFSIGQLLSNSQMTLEHCIEYAQEHSPTVKMARYDYLAGIYQYKKYKAEYMPQLSLMGSAPGLDRSINQITNPDGTVSFVEQSGLYSNSRINISQRFAPTGATINLSSGISRIDIFGDNENFYWRTTPFQISITQPLFKYNYMKWENKLSDMRYENAKKRFNESMEDIAITVADKFFRLYIAQMDIKNSKFNLAINDTTYRISQGRYRVGKIAENDLLQHELAQINSQIALDEANLNYSNSFDDLKLFIGMNVDKEIEISVDLSIPDIKIDFETAYNSALENRSDIMNFNISQTQAELNVDRAKTNNDFDADLTISYGLNQSASRIPDSYNDLLDQERFNISFSMPLYQWGKKKYEVEAALAEKHSIDNDLEYKKRMFRRNIKYQTSLFSQFRKKAVVAKKSNNIAQRRFTVSKNRYVIGKIDMDAFFMAQREKDASFKSYINAQRSFWMAYYRIRRLTLFDFMNGVKVEHSDFSNDNL